MRSSWRSGSAARPGSRSATATSVSTSCARSSCVTGVPLSEATRRLAERLEVGVRLLPASDDRVRTFLTTPAGELDFQTWFVARRHADEVTAVRYEGAEASRPAPGVLEAIAEAEVVFLAPSNPFVSIRPILAVPGIVEALAGQARRRRLAARRRAGAARAARRDDGLARPRAGRARPGRALRGRRHRHPRRPCRRGRAPGSAGCAHRYGCARSRERRWGRAVLEAVR